MAHNVFPGRTWFELIWPDLCVCSLLHTQGLRKRRCRHGPAAQQPNSSAAHNPARSPSCSSHRAGLDLASTMVARTPLPGLHGGNASLRSGTRRLRNTPPSWRSTGCLLYCPMRKPYCHIGKKHHGGSILFLAHGVSSVEQLKVYKQSEYSYG